MATRVKEGLTAKEKRGTSPSSRKSPNTSKQVSPNKRHSSPTARRSIPNYLKPTVSSNLDPSKNHVKKHASSDTVQKLTLSRRRSLDNPLPIPHIQKTRTSSSPAERNTRSSSSASRITTTKICPSDKLSKVTKDAGKERYLHPRPGKKSSTSMKREEIEVAIFSMKPPVEVSPSEVNTTEVTSILQPKLQGEDSDSSITQVDEKLINVGKDNGMENDILVLEEKENMTKSEHESHEVLDVKVVESSLVLPDQDTNVGIMIEEPKDKLHVDEITSNYSKIGQYGETEKHSSHPEKNINEESRVEIEKEEAEEAKEDTSVQKSDEKEENSTTSQILNRDETKSTEDVAKETKKDTKMPTTQPQVIQGKRDAAILSNNVIEETASKLQEERKNRVKALAGAFETVISLQENK